jgi:hypothetical protein
LNKKCVLLTKLGLPSTANMSKVEQRTTNHTVGTVIESAESLVSSRPQIATSVGDTEEDLESEQTQRSRTRGKGKNHSM